MLLLGRFVGQRLMIGDDVTVTVVGCNMKSGMENHGPEITLAIDAPKSIPVHREEIYKKIKEAERQVKEAEESA